MSKRFRFICLFTAWCCASGALLDLAQVFAWARMFAGYARTMSVGAAAVRTMDPDQPCAICLAVRRAREAERHQQPAPVQPSVEKMLLAQVQNEPFFLVPIRPEWTDGNQVPVCSWCAPVTVPPPRELLQT
jgi:hypothetical protein